MADPEPTTDPTTAKDDKPLPVEETTGYSTRKPEKGKEPDKKKEKEKEPTKH